MKEKRILLISFDKEYIDKIVSKLPFMLNDNSKLSIISTLDSFTEFMKNDHPEIEVLIKDEAINDNILTVQPAEKVYSLVESSDSKNSISKYDAVDGIANKLGKAYIKDSEKPIGKTKVIDVCSVSGGCAKTRAAIGISAKLSKMGYSVLYVDAEEMQNFYEYLPVKWKAEWADRSLAIAFMNGLENGTVETIIQKNRFDYVPAFRDPIYAYNIFLKSYYDMVRMVADKEIYDYIVVEHENGITKDLAQYLSNSKVIAICVRDGRGEADRLERYTNNLVDYNGRFVVICNSSKEADTDINKKMDEYKLPVCEIIDSGSGNTDAEKLLEGSEYIATVTAVK